MFFFVCVCFLQFSINMGDKFSTFKQLKQINNFSCFLGYLLSKLLGREMGPPSFQVFTLHSIYKKNTRHTCSTCIIWNLVPASTCKYLYCTKGASFFSHMRRTDANKDVLFFRTDAEKRVFCIFHFDAKVEYF